jgi:hypothetical protein
MHGHDKKISLNHPNQYPTIIKHIIATTRTNYKQIGKIWWTKQDCQLITQDKHPYLLYENQFHRFLSAA